MNLLTREEIIDIVSKLHNGGYGSAEEADRSVEILKKRSNRSAHYGLHIL